MQELHQTQNKLRTPGKSAWVPLVLLIIPIATFLLFLIFGFTVPLLQRGLLSAPQPAWLHFCVTHQKLFARLFATGLLCSGLNSFATILWLRHGDSPPQARHKDGIPSATLFLGGGFLLVILVVAGPLSYKHYYGSQNLSQSPILNSIVTEYLPLIGILILTLGLFALVTVTTFISIFELFARLKRPATGV